MFKKNKESPVNKVTQLFLLSINPCIVPKQQGTSCFPVEVKEAVTSHARVSNVHRGRSTPQAGFFFLPRGGKTGRSVSTYQTVVQK